ncbi:MAG: shikimate dehydrogenase [Tissierellia bacterium]|nr:shikimate dehydrogenase [Tissierellia bacterium]
MDITWNTQIYCLIGHPISKSLSPIIHNNFFQINRLQNIYISFDVKKNDLQTVINSFKILDIKGFNVTLPHKISIIEYLDDLSFEAKTIGAVNTVENRDGKLIGYNTDGMGFIKSLKLNGVSIKDKSILILGAGGVANAIAMSLAMEGVRKIFINNRTMMKARRLSNRIKDFFPEVVVEYGNLELNNIPKDRIDMIINCTSVGMYPKVDESPIDLIGFSSKLIVYDTIYKPQKTKFMRLARKKGYPIMGGLSMLINQALCSQAIWNKDEKFKTLKDFKEIRRILNTYVE